MAIYHLSGKIIARSQGRSSVAAAAYRAAERLLDEHTQLIHDFLHKAPDILHKDILLPKNAPPEFKDRAILWNTVEHIEKRKDAQLAREFTIALPKELTFEQNIHLAKDFVQAEFVDKGMVADVCVHRGHQSGEEQPHLHVMLSLRTVDKEGFGQKERAWNDRALLRHWREAWAEHCNRTLARHGIDMNIDHRTLEAQGIPLEPQNKIGPKACQAQMARFEEHQRIARDNGERILKDPSIAIHALTQQQSTMTHHDIARFVNRHTAGTEQFTHVFEAVKASPALVYLGQDEQGRARYTSLEMLEIESNLLHNAQHQAGQATHPVLAHTRTRALETRTLSPEQTQGFAHLTKANDLVCLVGFAGTGKSYLLGATREAWEAEGYQVQGVTLSGIAAQNLTAASGIESHTLANRLINWEHDRARLIANDIVVVDEAGMIGSRQMNTLLNEASQAKAKVVLIGDPAQLQAIDAGAAFRAISEEVGYVTLTDIRRQQAPWQQNATRQLALGKVEDALLAYDKHDQIHRYDNKAAAIQGIIAQWEETRSNQPDKSQLILAYTREEVRTLNTHARETLRCAGELGKDYTLETHQGPRDIAVGDKLYFLRNDKQLDVKNGTLGTVTSLKGKELTVRVDHFDKPATRGVRFNLSDYNAIDHGYAATIHKAQGMTVDRTHVLASRYLDRHSTYVALSRHREGAGLYVSRDAFPSQKAMTDSMSRDRPKDMTIDYAAHRGLGGLDRQAAPQERSLSRANAPPTQTHPLERLEHNLGLKLSQDLAAGDTGLFKGMAELEGQRYGILDQGHGQGKLIPTEQLVSKHREKTMVIEAQIDPQGQERLMGVQPQERQRTIELELRREGPELELERER